jgi:purple acid phosphatase-like protein
MRRATLAMASAVMAMAAASSAAAIPPSRVHLSWRRNATSSTMTVTWTTAAATATSTVRYGATTSYGLQAAGSNRSSSALGAYVHEVEITGLAADTQYHYSCGDGAGGWSADATFRTATPKGAATPFTFVVWSDTQNDSGGNDGFVRTTAMVGRILARAPRFTIHTATSWWAPPHRTGAIC